MKGGYQILDLSSVTIGIPNRVYGLYKIVTNNHGKPIMLKTPDGQSVFCQSNFTKYNAFLSYLGADGSTYKVTITNANTVTIIQQPSDADTAERVDVIEKRLDANNLEDPPTVDLREYDGSEEDKFYITQSDGYVWIRIYDATNVVQVNIKSPNNTNYDECVVGSATHYIDRMVYVKKGMILSCTTNIGNNNIARFVALL